MYHNKILAYNLQLLKDMGLPDYSQAYSISFNGSETYTVPCDSILVGGYYARTENRNGTTTSTGYLAINGVSTRGLSSRRGIHAEENGGVSFPLLVKQGDILSIDASNGYHNAYGAEYTAIPLV